MSTWLIADTHFGDNDIRIYEGRPFASVAIMDDAILSNWNAIVSDEDEVYHLGDVGDLSKIAALKGHKYLILGNHDTKSAEEYLQAGFEKVYDMPIIVKDYFMLSHAPLYVTRNAPYANLFGHVHGSPAYKTVSERSYCVSVERTEYRPVKLEDLILAMKKEEENYDSCH